MKERLLVTHCIGCSAAAVRTHEVTDDKGKAIGYKATNSHEPTIAFMEKKSVDRLMASDPGYSPQQRNHGGIVTRVITHCDVCAK